MDSFTADPALVFMGSTVNGEGRRVSLYMPRATHPDTLRRLRAEVHALSAPAPRKQILAAIAKCWALCKRRAESDDDTELALAAFEEMLGRYPADAVTEVLAEWPDRNVFTPAWAELKPKIEARCFRRRQMLETLDGLLGVQRRA